jgi:hypothetical protein
MIETIKILNTILKGSVIFVGGVSLYYLGLKEYIRDIDIVVPSESVKLLDDVKYFDNSESVLDQPGVERATAVLNGVHIDLFIHKNDIDTNTINIGGQEIKIASLKDHIKHYTMLNEKVKSKNMNVSRYSEMLDTLTAYV